jgi:hypothetical protein
VLPTSPLELQAIFAINYLGALYVPVNPALKGSSLEHVLHNAGAAFAIVHDSVLDGVLAAAPPALKTMVRSSDAAAAAPPGGVAIHNVSALTTPAAPPPQKPIRPFDTQFIIYTSGTTGCRILDELKVRGDHRKQVVEVVRDAARELVDRFHLLALVKLLLGQPARFHGVLLLGDISEVDREALAGGEHIDRVPGTAASTVRFERDRALLRHSLLKLAGKIPCRQPPERPRTVSRRSDRALRRSAPRPAR